MDIATCLKAHGIDKASSCTSDSDSGGKSDLDDNYYRYLPAPIPEQQLLNNSVNTAKLNIDKQENGSPSLTVLYSQMLKQGPSKTNESNVTQEFTKVKKKKKKKSTGNNMPQNLPALKEQRPPEHTLNHKNQIQCEINNMDSEKLSKLIRNEITKEFEKFKLEQCAATKKNQPALKKSKVAQSLPSIPQATKQSAKSKKQTKQLQQNSQYLVEAKKIEKIFNYVDSADKCLRGIIKKTRVENQQQNGNHPNKLENVLEYIQYAHKALQALSQQRQSVNNKSNT